MTKAEILMEENLESVSQRGESHRTIELNGSTAGLNDNQSDVAASSSNVNLDFDYQDIAARSEDDKGSYIKGHPRFVLKYFPAFSTHFPESSRGIVYRVIFHRSELILKGLIKRGENESYLGK